LPALSGELAVFISHFWHDNDASFNDASLQFITKQGWVGKGVVIWSATIAMRIDTET
jgi:hypothetical protein